MANGQLLLIILVGGGALLLVSLLVRLRSTYLGLSGVICAVMALLVVGGLVTIGTIARVNLIF